MRLFGKRRDTVDETQHHKAEKYYTEGLTILHTENNAESSLEKFIKAIEIDPLYAEAYALAARCYRQMHNNIRAMQYYTRALDIDATLDEVRFERAMLFWQMKRMEQALWDFERLADTGGDKQLGMSEQIHQNIEKLRRARDIQKASADTKIIPRDF